MSTNLFILASFLRSCLPYILWYQLVISSAEPSNWQIGKLANPVSYLRWLNVWLYDCPTGNLGYLPSVVMGTWNYPVLQWVLRRHSFIKVEHTGLACQGVRVSVPNWPGRHDDWRVDPAWMMDDGWEC